MHGSSPLFTSWPLSLGTSSPHSIYYYYVTTTSHLTEQVALRTVWVYALIFF